VTTLRVVTHGRTLRVPTISGLRIANLLTPKELFGENQEMLSDNADPNGVFTT